MTGLPLLTVLGWLCSAALALTVARRHAAAVAHAEHLQRVAHELRGPLHAAGLVLVSARRHAGDDECRRSLDALEVELGRAALATGDLQADGGSRAVAPETCDAAALVADLAAGWRAIAEAQGRSLDVHLPAGSAWVAGERLRLAQALGNLVANALEHGAGHVDVIVAAGRDGGVQVEVRDEGQGLPAPVASLVARAPDPARPRGRGLGIAAAIAADTGGRLAAAPTDRGARLVLALTALPGCPLAS